jgi:hypothetical protein
LEKIIIITNNEKVNRFFLQCLELLFPECDVELFYKGEIYDHDSCILDDMSRGNNGPYEEFDS